MNIVILIKQIFFLILFSSLTYSQTNWIWQNPIPTGNDLNDLQFTDPNTGYATGNVFTVLKTTNSGENWNLKTMEIDTFPSESNGILKTIFFLNSITGYAGGSGFFKTTNGGDNWIYRNVGEFINSIYFTSLDTGYMAYLSGKIFKTTNGGSNWILQYTTNNLSLNKIYFISSNTGFAVGENQNILKTTNGGDNWVLKFSGSSFDLFDINFVDSANGFAGGSFGYFYKTTNSGETWLDLRNSQLGYIRTVRFTSLDTGYIIADNGNKIFKTVNRGNQWSLLMDLGFYISNLSVLHNDNFVISCAGGNIYKSTNGGINWDNKIKTVTTSDLRSISFGSENTGFIAGYNNTILKTTNSGMEWQTQNSSPGNEDYRYIKFFDNNNGYLAGSNLYKTSNSGLNWISLINLNYLKYINFINIDTGYIVKSSNQFADYDTLYKTSDGGNTWISLNKINSINSICILQKNDFIYTLRSGRTGSPPAVYFYNDVYKSINNGINWTLLYHFDNGFGGGNYSYISFLNENTGLVFGNIGMKKTTDGGTNWFSLSVPLLSSEIFFCNQNIGYASSYNTIVKTTNAGNNWTEVFNSSNYIASYFFKDYNTGYAIGNLGYILKTTNGGGIFVNTSEDIENIPSSYYLYQNYPNPFNPNTKIVFELPDKSIVKLFVYDLLGREIIELVNENLSAGTHEAKFNGANLSSGIYFYKLETEKFSQTKRMLLIK